MSTAPKTSSSLQAYHMLLYRNALHPEFFDIHDRRRLEHGDYEFESWITRGGHALRFEHDDLCVTEVICDFSERMPERGLVTIQPCAGERDHESRIAERIDYMTSIQTETLSDHLYLSTYNELLEHGKAAGGLLTTWEEDDRQSLSLLDLQRYREEVHVQGYHLRPDSGLVLRTQTIFQIADGEGEESDD